MTDSIFVIMPFREDFDDVFFHIKFAVQEAAAEIGRRLRCFRADELSTPGRISDQVLESLRAAALVIADLSDNNPNVMYELGYAHALGKKVVIVNGTLAKVTFDVKDFRQIPYSRQFLSRDIDRPIHAAVTAVFSAKDSSDTAQADHKDRLTVAPPSTLRPSSSLVATIQAYFFKLQLANRISDVEQARQVALALRDTVQRIVVTAATPRDDQKNTGSVIGNCTVLLEEAGLLEEAADIYRRSLGLFPDHEGLRVQYADYLLNAGHFDEAETEIARAQKISPDDDRIPRLRAKLFMARGRVPPEFKSDLRMQFDAEPGVAQVAVLYLLVLQEQNVPVAEFREACKRWEDAAPAEEKAHPRRALADYLASRSGDAERREAVTMYENLLTDVMGLIGRINGRSG